MSRTFRDTLDYDAQHVFTDAKAHAEALIHYPAGDLASPEPVNGVVDRDAEDAGGAGSGEGAQFDRVEGVNVRRSAILEIPIATTVTEDSGRASTPSLFEFGGGRWRTVRILGRDSALQSVLVTRNDKLVRRRMTR